MLARPYRSLTSLHLFTPPNLLPEINSTAQYKGASIKLVTITHIISAIFVLPILIAMVHVWSWLIPVTNLYLVLGKTISRPSEKPVTAMGNDEF